MRDNRHKAKNSDAYVTRAPASSKWATVLSLERELVENQKKYSKYSPHKIITAKSYWLWAHVKSLLYAIHIIAQIILK